MPEGQPLIAGLASGQVRSSGQSVTLRFSNRQFACGTWLTEITSEASRAPCRSRSLAPSRLFPSGRDSVPDRPLAFAATRVSRRRDERAQEGEPHLLLG